VSKTRSAFRRLARSRTLAISLGASAAPNACPRIVEKRDKCIKVVLDPAA